MHATHHRVGKPRCVDISAQKEYNYIYDDGHLVCATEYAVTLTGEFVTGRTIVATVRYFYDKDGKLSKKVVLPASGTPQTTHYKTGEDDNTTVSFTVPAPTAEDPENTRTVTCRSKADNFGRKAFDEIQLGRDSISRQYAYAAGRVTDEHKATNKVKSSPTTQLVSQIVFSGGRTVSYEYDEEERITRVTDSAIGSVSYTYDALGQLETETVDGVTTKFAYNNYGNIIAKGVVDSTGEIAEATKIVYTYGNTVWRDLLTAYNGQSIDYDFQGNPTSYLGHTLTWEKGRQLKSFVKSDGTAISYSYNSKGIRTGKTVNGLKHTYTLEGTKILCEAWGDNTLIPLRDNTDSICGILYNNVPYYFQRNLQGDIIGILNKDAETVATYAYDAWGVCSIVTDTSDCAIAAINPFRYRGYYYDAETRMYYLQSRYYDPAIGRFVNVDKPECIMREISPLVLNLLTYCENNVVVYVDDAGTKKKCIFKYANMTILTIKDFYKESEMIRKKFEREYDFFNVDIAEINGYFSFKDKWDSMLPQDVVVINCHADPNCLASIIEKHQVAGLNFKRIKALILLGCNAGHYDYIWDNVAHAFSEKISGCVMASDGTVWAGFRPIFKSINNSIWRIWSSRKKNWGWVIYQNRFWYSTNMKTISINSAVDYLENCGMLNLSIPLGDYPFPDPNVYYA